MIDLPTVRQTFDFDCGAKALEIVMAYYGVEVREDELMEELKCDSDGTPVQNMISVAEKKGFQVMAKCGVSLETVKQYVDENHPVIVLVQAWAERYMPLEDWKEDNDDGHYAIVIGYHGYVIVFEDPSSIRRTWMTEEEFIARWHDIDPRTKEKLDHFAMVLLGKQPAGKVLEHMD
ncbi:MAG: cysteine peptidase family C39 domain-containing protein [Dehalococcoidia bacterium]|nr:cysteine peptidase family C39 domain-containing protein [Dehalococcoidia bacterium]